MKSIDRSFCHRMLCGWVLAAARGRRFSRPSGSSRLEPVAEQMPAADVDSREDVALRISPVAVDCTSVTVFAPLAPEGEIFGRDACDDVAEITVGIDGHEVPLERIGGPLHAGGTRLSYEGEAYRVEVEGKPGFWLPLTKGEETRTGCREFEERVDVMISHGARTLIVPSRMTARCP